MKLDRHEIEQWFPIYLRYLGSILAVVLTIATILGHAGLEYAAAWSAAAGMIGWKSVHDYGRGKVEEQRDLSIEEAALRAAARGRRRA